MVHTSTFTPVPFFARATITTWWLLTLTLIGSATICCALTSYCCLSSIVQRNWPASGGFALAAIGSAGATCLLCLIRGDLVGDL